MDHQDILCNRIGGRITGSDAYTNACAWALNELKGWGLKVSFDEVGEVPVGFNRGPWFGKMIKPVDKPLYFGTPTMTAGPRASRGAPWSSPLAFWECPTKIDSI